MLLQLACQRVEETTNTELIRTVVAALRAEADKDSIQDKVCTNLIGQLKNLETVFC